MVPSPLLPLPRLQVSRGAGKSANPIYYAGCDVNLVKTGCPRSVARIVTAGASCCLAIPPPPPPPPPRSHLGCHTVIYCHTVTLSLVLPRMRLPQSLRPHRPRGSHCPTGTCPALPPLPCSQRRRGTLPFSMPPLHHPPHPPRKLIPALNFHPTGLAGPASLRPHCAVPLPML